MRCPFCQASHSSVARVCHVCGGPLSGINKPLSPSPQPKDGVSLAASAPLANPTLPIDSIKEVPPPKPVIFACRTREKNAPRIVAALFCPAENDSHPLFVLETGELQGWDVERDELHAFPLRRTLRKPGLTTAAAFSSQCETVATGHILGQVRLQRLEPRGERAAGKWRAFEVIEAHRGCVLSLAAVKTRLYSAGSDGAVVLTNLPGAPNTKTAADRKPQVILDGLGALSCLAVSPDGRLLALGADDGQVQMWHLTEDGTKVRLEWTSRKDLSRVKSLMFAPNGNMLLSCSAQGHLCLWAAQTGHRLQWMAQPNGLISPAFASDSRLLSHANTFGGISLCDAWTGALLHTLPPVPGGVQALGFSPATETGARETLLIVAGAQQIAAWKVSF